MMEGISESTLRDIVRITAETLGDRATPSNVKSIVSQVIQQIQNSQPAPVDTNQRQKYYIEMLGDWLRTIENREHPTARSAPKSQEPQTANFIVTALGQDRPGIIARLTTVLGTYNCSIMDMSQQILSGYFTVIMVVNLNECTIDFAALRDQLIKAGDELGIKVLVQHQDVFEYMHRI